jgi:hypothetical protein
MSEELFLGGTHKGEEHMKNPVLLAAVAVTTLGVATPAHAGDCWTMLEKHFTWAKSAEYSKERNLTFHLATNRGDAAYVSYAVGVMDVNTSVDPWLFTTTAQRTGNRDGTQYFSDRQYQECYSYGCFPVGPFNRAATDVLGVRMTWWGQVTFTMKSWGNGELTGTGDCNNEMLTTTIGNTLFVLSFKQTSSTIIY